MEIKVGKTAGFCYGVERAVNGAIEETTTQKEVYCLGEIVHNKEVVDSLKQKGIKFIENIEEAKGKTIIRAHGVSKDIYGKAKKMNISLKDLTCPSVLKIHNIAKDYAERGYFIILTGKENHPEIIGIQSYCGEKYKIINDKSQLNEIIDVLKDEENIALISQTTYSSKKFDEISEILKNMFSENKNIEIRKTICPSTEIRQKETEKIAKNVDLMIIIGDKKSSNTNKLYDISCEFCDNVIFINNKQELNLNRFKNIQKVGVMAGASTPKKEINEIIELLNTFNVN